MKRHAPMPTGTQRFKDKANITFIKNIYFIIVYNGSLKNHNLVRVTRRVNMAL